MAPAASLYFNDAPWLLESQRQEGRAEGLRLVHPDVSLAAAALLGGRSIRCEDCRGCSSRSKGRRHWSKLWQLCCGDACIARMENGSAGLGHAFLRFCRHQAWHEVSDQVASQLPCPTPKQLQAVLARQGLLPPAVEPSTGESVQPAAAEGAAAPDLAVLTALLDLLEAADAAGCASLTLVLDCRHHPNQSLLHTGLAVTQGEQHLPCRPRIADGCVHGQVQFC